MMTTRKPWVTVWLAGLWVMGAMAWTGRAEAPATLPDEDPLLFGPPGDKVEMHFGDVGVTGLKLRIYPGLVLKVEATTPGTPAEGKFNKGEVITAVNGIVLKGRNPFWVLGNALTAAEASDGRLIFEVQSAEGADTRKVTVLIPVLGAYSPTWPLNCKKSQAIIKGAAAYYARTWKYVGGGATELEQDLETHGIGGALACLFLLSTGDDQHLPRVKAFCDGLAEEIRKGVTYENETWYVGYKGIACAEYYLRTGDSSMLPVLQHYCEFARVRQFYGIGWGHGDRQINPGYVAGGLMNPAGTQVLTTLLLAKECGVKVDEPTLMGALKYFYRFAGHGSVAYGDHRGEGGIGSNGKDGMGAAIMQAASGARGNVDIYRQARDYFGLSMLESYARLVSGHGDQGRGDAIWRGIASAYVMELRPAEYRTCMNRLEWWYDLSRRPSGALGVATCQRFDDEGSGAGVALSYTAPLKTLRLTGAPRSKYAKAFTLPESLWGRKADLAFLSIENGEHYRQAASNEPIHVTYSKLGSGYGAPGSNDLMRVSREELVKNVYHWHYMVRAQAAKALMHTGAFGELEKLLQDADPRVRRAALDGLTDYRYWGGMGKNPIQSEAVSAAMLAAIRKMLADPDEAIYVVDGALMALSCAPASEIADSLQLIRPWTNYDEWWVRQSAFLALVSAARDANLAPKVLPIMAQMLVRETRTQARETMRWSLAGLLQTYKPDTEAGRQIVEAFKRAAGETEINAGPRAIEGSYHVTEAATACLQADPATAADVARIVTTRFLQLDTRQLTAMVNTLLSIREKLKDPAREELTGILYGAYRQEFIRRMKAGELPLDILVALTQLRDPGRGWRELGTPASAERVCRFMSFEPQGKDVLDPREGKRFRDVALPAGLETWYLPEFDASSWQSGKTPVGKGVFKAKRGTAVIENRSTWGDGEFLLLRSAFDLAALDYDYYRIGILANQGYDIYLNGQKIHSYPWYQGGPTYRAIWMRTNDVACLRKGTNVLSVRANAAYADGMPVGQLDIRLEGLKKADLVGEGAGQEGRP